MSFCDVFLSQMSTFSNEDVERVYYKLKDEHERRVKARIAKEQMNGQEKVESLFPDLYRTCKSIKVVQCDKNRVKIHFIPKDDYIITGNFSGSRNPLEPPYSISMETFNEIIDITVDLNRADSCTSYPDLWYSYRNDTGYGETYPYKCNRGRCDKYLPGQLLDLELISKTLKNPKQVWDFLTK